MNRNQMYQYLKEIGLYPVMHRRGPKKKHRMYHIEFVPDKNKNHRISHILTDWGYIEGFEHIHLYANEVALESNYEFCKININYRDIEKFEVVMFDEDEE